MRRIPANLPILTASAMRMVETAAIDAGVTQLVLMERASRAIARETARFARGRPVLVIAGPGNNGGDAFGAACLLRDQGHDVVVATFGAPKDGAAATMAARWQGPCVPVADATPRAILIDGLFGIGLTRDLDAALAATLARLVAASEFSIAIDLPAGVDTDSGGLRGAPDGFDLTVALGALKPAHVIGAASSRCGTVIVDPIGLRAESSWRTLTRPVIDRPRADAHKYSRGMVAVISGAMPGAARLAARAALHGGAGYSVLCGGQGGPDALVHRPIGDAAALLDDDRVGALVIGPGLGLGDAARTLVEQALRSARPLVIDGDALGILGQGLADRLRDRPHPVVLTPHGGEFDRCFGAGEATKIRRTLAAARATGAAIVHKGYDTVIASPDGRVRVAAAMTSWLSTAGTGDVLAGLVAARLAISGVAEEAVWLHGRAAALAGPGFVADDLIAQIGRAIGECR